MALACSELQDGCYNYFSHKDTVPVKQVSIILGCFEDIKINNWMRPATTCKRLTALTFNEFMAEFCKKFLKPDWKEATRKEVLSSHMKKTETFEKWVTHVQSLTALLTDNASASSMALDDKHIRHTLKAGMPDLSRRYTNNTTAPKVANTNIDEWLRQVVEIDDAHHYEDECMAFFVANAEKGKHKVVVDTGDEHLTKKPFTPLYKANVNAKPSSSSFAPSSAALSGFCPPLTNNEHALLKANDGCNKCRVFFAGHRSNSCPNGYPSATSYTERTQANIAATKKLLKGKSVAIIMPGVEDQSDSEDDSDEPSDMSLCSPHRVAHLHWDCLVEEPMSNLPLEIIALIDNGAHLVLIDADLVNKLEMRRFKLHKLEPVSLAMTPDDAEPIHYLTEYVKLCLHSRH
ncbi:hypothetical protein B0H17DRAFT_1191418 [Mycena rosella]|uniref:Retrotransposon gag domain-containing protein n=1 Tax=Mycena rosella TaxID=1033263 RepID=A0AAD7MB93_MYCRO|nr:hypothetical protein B0H17DRAFT_1191418 [Mycena rosella]